LAPGFVVQVPEPAERVVLGGRPVPGALLAKAGFGNQPGVDFVKLHFGRKSLWTSFYRNFF
jgi:hypothetical protein